MTPKYWFRIFLGIAVIFGIGLLVKQGVHRGASLVDRMEGTVPLLSSSRGFRLDDDHVGDIQRLQFLRSTPGRVDSAVISIKLASDDDGKEFDDCVVRVINGHPFGRDTKFECTDADDSTQLALVPFGHLEIAPAGTIKPLYIASSALETTHQHAYRGVGSDSGNVDIQASDGNFSVTINGRQLVQASGNGGSGSFVVRGPDGKPIVEMSGDTNGHSSIRVLDKDGKAKVNISTGGKKDTGGHF